ncbi:exonuclease/endonuclease/phosphatase family protein [Piscirickettsia litoralis]|uniref:Inositol polyphosphate-related phosphatase domain-containing protein n=1 Tax=Piscirickettsia litoralis TaxID=1891921 RepID=A0ABX3A448_9GAMM|nr:hypothetical protein [Piscirickettsia litoralis]ODN43637.1 hypothetical protein BGC07_12865 [Piscirickettsia litoralis]
MGKYKVTALTWNMGNENVGPDSVDTLVESLKRDKSSSPDVILVSTQEAKRTWGNRTLSDRIAKRMAHEGEKYQVLHQNDFRVVTKPKNPLTYFGNIPRTHLGIIVKPGVHVSIDHITPPGTIRGNNLNKGGLYAVLTIGDQKIGVIGCHLDSNDQKQRAQETKRLLQGVDGKKLDNIIFMGDLNERLNSESLQTIDTKRKRAVLRKEEENKLIENHDPISGGKVSHFNKHDIKFNQLDKFTYHERKSKGEIKYKPKRGTADVGVLDNIGLKSKAKTVQGLGCRVIDVQNKEGKQVSDHKPVIRHFEVTSEKSATPEYKLAKGKDWEAFKKIYNTLYKAQNSLFKSKSSDIKDLDRLNKKLKQPGIDGTRTGKAYQLLRKYNGNLKDIGLLKEIYGYSRSKQAVKDPITPTFSDSEIFCQYAQKNSHTRTATIARELGILV